MKKRFLVLLSMLVSLTLLAPTLTLIAQDTPTPAPSKTPEGATIEATAEAGGIPEDTTLPRSYAQADLSVFTGNVQRPNGMIWMNGQLFIVCNGDWTLYQVDPNDGGTTVTFIAGVRNAHDLYGEKTEEGFNLWLPDYDSNILFITNQDRRVIRRIANEGLDGPWGIAPLDDTFLITNLKGDNIVNVERDGTVTEIASGLRSPAGIVIDEDYVYVSNNGSARRAIEWFEKSQIGSEVTLNSLVTGLQSVSNLVMANDGYLYFTYSLGTRGVVGRVDPEQCRENGCSNEQVEIVVYTELQAPLAGLAISPDMELFVHTIYRPEIYKVKLYQQE